MDALKAAVIATAFVIAGAGLVVSAFAHGWVGIAFVAVFAAYVAFMLWQ